jgi:hypothetical protein
VNGLQIGQMEHDVPEWSADDVRGITAPTMVGEFLDAEVS